MIGLRVQHDGILCQVIEVLEDGPSVVLMDVRRDTIQANQFGGPGRWVPETYTVPVLTADRSALHPAFLQLDLYDE